MANRILFFSAHRSGSTYAHRACILLCKACGITYWSPNPGGDFRLQLREVAQQPEFWQDKQGCFGPLRFYMDVPGCKQDRIILHLRDPRDVLPSMFYSYCYAHIGEIAGNCGYRREVAERGIDAFVLAMSIDSTSPVMGDYGTGSHLWDLAGNVVTRYRRYLQNLVGQPNVVLVKYEQMVSNQVAWLRTVAEQFDPDRAQLLADEVSRALAADAQPALENVWSYKRSVTPGDHRSKLAPRTIQILNELYAEPLSRLGYV